MKSLKDYSLNLPEAEYHAYPAWSYSMISRYAKEGFSSIAGIHEPITTTPSMEFGSLFDSIITKGKTTLDEYVIDRTDAASIPPAEKSVFDTLLAMGCGHYSYDELLNEHSYVLENAISASESFCSKYKKPETRYQKLQDSVGYWDIVRSGKKVVSGQDWEDAMEMYKAFRANEYVSSIFGTKSTKDIEYLYQTQYAVDYTLDDGRTVKIKIMPDLLVVNHKEKTIQPVDLKTSSMPGYAFSENFVKFRYDLQASVYTDVLEVVIHQDADYQDYIILPYLFTDISRSDKVPVTYIYDTTGEQYQGLLLGIDKQYKYKGWKQLLSEILDYEETQAVVPSYIDTKGPNDIVAILNMKR